MLNENAMQYNCGARDGIRFMESKLLRAVEDGMVLDINGRAWFLKSDIQNLRDIFLDMESEAKEEPVICDFTALKQLFFDCAANLMLMDKSRKEVANDLLKALAELDKYKVVEEINNGTR